MPFDRLLPVLLLLGSNIFMTFAWYRHLKYQSAPLLLAILRQLGHRLLRVRADGPGQPLGRRGLFTPQLKGMQEVITLVVFAGFSAWYLDQPLKWNHWAGFGLIAVAAWLIFLDLEHVQRRGAPTRRATPRSRRRR